MNKEKLFCYLEQQPSDVLMKLLDDCYSCMKVQDIRDVFVHLENSFLEKTKEDGASILKRTKKFMEDSLKGMYYAPFNINSKNYMDIPEETNRWFETLGELLIESTLLSTQGDHSHAVQCFGVLFELIDKMESGDEIIFADEAGMWMLPIREEPCIKAYVESAAAVFEPEEYVNAVLPVIRYDSHSSFVNKAYKKAKRAANEQQKALLEEKIIAYRIKKD